MRLLDTAIDAVKIIELTVHGDARGFFVERYHQQKLADAGFSHDFVQDNHSRSAPGILRGLHYQTNPAQGKLVGVTRGRVYDVAVDIRPDSATYGHYVGAELSDENGRLLWVPPGFAHGFCVLDNEPVDMLYKVTGVYNAAGEGGIRFDDADLAIDWPISNPQLSERDKNLPSFADYRVSPPQWNR